MNRFGWLFGISLAVALGLASACKESHEGGDTQTNWLHECKASAECGVYFFGAGQGGTVEANLERWKSQFKDPNGKVAPAQIAKRTIHGLTVTTIDTAGEYSGMGGPMAASSSTVQGYRLLGAIVTASGGNIFVKLTGPAKTIAANQQKFEQMLASFQPDK